MPLEKRDWAQLPDHVLVAVFSYLAYPDRARAARSCQTWNEVFSSPYLWEHFTFWFYTPRQARALKCLESHGCHLKSVLIELDQSVEGNRDNACKVLEELAQQKERRLKFLKVKFAGENPCFYAGKEFITALMQLFGPPPEKVRMVHQLQEVDLSGLTVGYGDQVLNELSANHSQLQNLNIQNNVLVCQVTPECMIRLVQRCRKLKKLSIFKYSASEDMLLALTEEDRVPLEHLSLACRREEKYGKGIGSDMWSAVVKKLPNLRVTLYFDHTCPLLKVGEVMKPEVPVSILRLETFTYIYDEVRLATAYYKNTLEKMVLQTPLSRNSPELNAALLELSQACHKLKALHVYCVLEKDTIDKILADHPEMQLTKSYTLKDT